MARRLVSERLIASRASLPGSLIPVPRPDEAEGGCGVVGIACGEPVAGRHLLRALEQMKNRGNGKGGGIAAVGLVPEELGVSREVLEKDYLLAIAYLDPSSRPAVEREHLEPVFDVDLSSRAPANGGRVPLPVQPPEVWRYFVRPKKSVLDEFRRKHAVSAEGAEDELVYQNSYRLNHACYAAGAGRAFVLSHGKNMLVLKMVGYGDDVIHHYALEDFHAHVWIGHHRYPTKGRVWHPGGAHPFIGLNEALVHNGDFANYASMCEYLAQRNIRPLFLTDTEVSVLVFDLLHRVYGYPLEYVIEALAPTTERDSALLPPEKRRVYAMIQAVHMHGSPDGPWFFLIAQSLPDERAYRLIGITDTSMLRPQVFAFQQGSVPIGFAASEKQAIDAVLESLSAEDPRFWTHADRYWNARGGSHTDGGAFFFDVRPGGDVVCVDKFGARVAGAKGEVRGERRDERGDGERGEVRGGGGARDVRGADPAPGAGPDEWFRGIVEQIPSSTYEDVRAVLAELAAGATDDGARARALEVVTLLMDRRYPTGTLKRSRLLSLCDEAVAAVVESLRQAGSEKYVRVAADFPLPEPTGPGQTAVLDARLFAVDGERSLARAMVRLHQRSFRSFIVVRAAGHRFIANGLGPVTNDVRMDVYGSPGDYLASGIDGAHVLVHGNGQDQLAQIMKFGTLVVFGDVGQTFMYAAKGGRAFVLGNAAGRPLINAVGGPRVVINGTCLDYLAESFMAGDPLNGGGYVIVNGVRVEDDGGIVDLETPYPGGNLFSLASGGAIYLRDPHHRVDDEQLNGGEFTELDEADWALIGPFLEENAARFGIPVSRLLQVDGSQLTPFEVYRKIRPGRVRALEPEEAWVRPG